MEPTNGLFSDHINGTPEVVIWLPPRDSSSEVETQEVGNLNEVCVQMPPAYSISPFLLVTALFSRLGPRLAW